MSRWPATVYRVSGGPIEVSGETKLRTFEDLYGQDIRLIDGSPLHRTDGPAVEMADGTVEWWYGGVRYGTKQLWEKRSMVESYIDENQRRCWHPKDENNLRYHRDDGGPAVEYKGGERWEWWENGLLHREGKPAVIDNEDDVTEWWKNGVLHRENGPAIESKENPDEYWVEGKQLSAEEFFERMGIRQTRRDDDTVFYTKQFDVGRLLHRDGAPAVLHADGTREWYDKGVLHRENGPAVEKADGTLLWYDHGDLHRDNGPAAEHYNGDQEWYQHGTLHRQKGPAVIRVNGESEWYHHGQKYASKIVTDGETRWFDSDNEPHSFRDNRPAVVTEDREEYYQHGARHNESGPAVVHTDGKKEWYLNGERHNANGPAVVHASGRRAWYLDGERVTQKEFYAFRRRAEVDEREKERAAETEKVAAKVRASMKKAGMKKINLANQEYAHYRGTIDAGLWFISEGYKSDPNYWVKYGSKVQELAESASQVRARVFAAMHSVYGTEFTEEQFANSSFMKEKFVIIDTASPYEAYRQAYLMLNIDDSLKLGFDDSLKKVIRMAKENIGEPMLSRDKFEVEYAPARSVQRAVEDSGDWTAAAWSLAAAAMLGAVAGKALKPKKKIKKISKQKIVEVEKEKEYILAR